MQLQQQRTGSGGKMKEVLSKLFTAPKSEAPIKRSTSLRRATSSRFNESAGPLSRLASFKDVAEQFKEELFIKKLEQCCVMLDFTDPNKDVEGKEIKREALLQCAEYLLEKNILTESIYQAVFKMVKANLFRPLAPRVNPYGVQYDPEEDEPILEAAWDHIQIVYEFFLRFIDLPEINTQLLKTYIDGGFVTQLLDLIDTEDPRERDYLKTTIHRIYGKFLPLRAPIRQAIRDLFCTFVYETGQHNGIPELLEVLGSIINGFAIPIKEEHKTFLEKALLPLHKPKSLSIYHNQLSYCICQFLEKDANLTESIFRGILRMWPVSNSPKEIIMLSEVDELLQLVKPEPFRKIMTPLFKQLTKCFSSSHFQVAERALLLWNNQNLLDHVQDNLEIILPMVYGSLYTNSQHHWNRSICNLSFSSLQLFMDIDIKLYNRVAVRFKESQKSKEKGYAGWMSSPVEPSARGRPHQRPLPPAEEPKHGNVRKKSLLPVDQEIIDALARHKSLEEIIADSPDSKY